MFKCADFTFSLAAQRRSTCHGIKPGGVALGILDGRGRADVKGFVFTKIIWDRSTFQVNSLRPIPVF